MEIITDPTAFQQKALKDRASGLTTALVPTMGFFHKGHISLMQKARECADRVYVSLFVNPTQFGPGEDLDAYPNDFERDAELAKNAGVDVLFAPKREDVYAPDHCTWVDVAGLGEHLCGKSRPVHFRGVSTVVSILFNLAHPTFAVFGQKDWQQLAIIRRMTRDMHFPVEIVGCPIVREKDGLALSSRNVYLTDSQRAQAPGLHAGLQSIAELVQRGERCAARLKNTLTEIYSQQVPDGEIDYIEIVDPESIQPIETIESKGLAAVAVRLGKARLIDNMVLTPSQ